MMKKCCRYYLIVAVVFLAISLADPGNLFFAFYPCLICGMIPVTLLAHDERSHFLQYSAALPYTKKQIVSAKYLIGLLAQLALLVVIGTVQGVRMSRSGAFVSGDFVSLMLLMLALSMLTSSISLPFVFKWGVEKGRIA